MLPSEYAFGVVGRNMFSNSQKRPMPRLMFGMRHSRVQWTTPGARMADSLLFRYRLPSRPPMTVAAVQPPYRPTVELDHFLLH